MTTRVSRDKATKAQAAKRAQAAQQTRVKAQVGKAPAPKVQLKDELSTGQAKRLRVAALRSEGAAPLGRVQAQSALRIDGRTTGDALWGMQEILEGKRESTDTGRGSKVERNAPDVNDKSDWDWRTDRYKRAKSEVEANRPLEEAALLRMSPQDREAYRAVRTQLEKSGDVVSLLALQRLLFTGKLPGAKDLNGGLTLLGWLGELANGRAPIADGLNRTALLTELVQELAVPSAINQGPRGTCGPTTALVELAMKHPAEYARLVMGLASPKGEVKTAGGETLRREPGTGPNDGTGRSSVQRLLGPALMELADERDYVDQTGENAGTTAQEQARLHDALFGTNWEGEAFKLVGDDAASKRKAIDGIRESLRGGQPVPAMIYLGEGGEFVNHWVLVVGRESRNGQEYVRFVNPWGQVETMTVEEFERRLRGVGQSA